MQVQRHSPHLWIPVTAIQKHIAYNSEGKQRYHESSHWKSHPPWSHSKVYPAHVAMKHKLEPSWKNQIVTSPHITISLVFQELMLVLGRATAFHLIWGVWHHTANMHGSPALYLRVPLLGWDESSNWDNTPCLSGQRIDVCVDSFDLCMSGMQLTIEK